jgi:hypothetical protein
MLLATNLSLLEWVLLGTILACGGGVLWRTFSRPATGSLAHLETEYSERAEARAEGRIGHLEVRLHDFAREVEARMETRAVQLDRLVVAADQEIIRLSGLLNKTPDRGAARQPDVTQFGAAPNGSQISPAQAEMIGHLDEAGYTVAEISHIVGQAPEIVQSLLKAA